MERSVEGCIDIRQNLHHWAADPAGVRHEVASAEVGSTMCGVISVS